MRRLLDDDIDDSVGHAGTGGRLADQAAPLDALLIDAALGSVRRFAPDLSTAKLGVALVRKPRTTARRLGSLVAETGRIAIGTSTVTPSRRDRRFADEAWTSNPLLRRIVQLYLAGAQTADELVADADLDWRDDQRMRFLSRTTSSRPSRRAMFRL